MALEDIFRALEQQAEKDIAQLTDDARSHAQAIMDEAEEQAAAARAARVVEAERHARTSSTQGLNAARLEYRKRLASVKERAVEGVFEEALGQLAAARGDTGYREVFARLAAEALEGVEGAVEVLVDPADEALAHDMLSSMGRAATVRPDLSTTGGLVVVSEGGSVSRRNTFEDRLDKFRSIAQADVAEIVFT